MINSDRKFLGPIRAVFEAAAPGRHRYVMVGPLDEGLVVPADVTYVTREREFANVLEEHQTWEGVVVHGVAFSTLWPMLRQVPARLAVAWYVWGYEAYSCWPPLMAGLYLPETSDLVRRLAPSVSRRIVSRGRRLLRGGVRDMSAVAARFDYFVAQFPEEYELFVATGLLKTTRYHWGSYGALEDYVDTSQGITAGQDIQVGNSGALSNNHLEAFSLLGGLDLGDRRAVVPLTYCDYTARELIVAAGRQRLGRAFTPLLDFVPQDEYLSLLASCGHVVMNHQRQQAVGNILAALWRGARLYMNDTSVYRALKNLGFHVDLITTLDGDGCDPFVPCPADDAVRHRELLAAHLDRERVIRETADLLERLSCGRP